MAGETTARVTPAETPAPVMMLSGGMQGGGLPPEVTNAPPANVQPQASDTFTTQPGPSMQPSSDGQQQQPQQMLSGPQISQDHEMQAAAVHHGRIGRAIDAVTKALGGNQTMHVVEMPDGSYVAKPMDSTPGERWSRIAKAALTGAAAGFAHGQGPGGPERAFAAGAQAGLALPQAEQDQTMQKAEQLEGQREKQTLFKKNMAMLDLQITKQNLENMQLPITYDQQNTQYADTRRDYVSKAHGKYLAHYANSKDLSDHVQTNQELLDTHVGKGGTLVQVPQFADGKITGYDVYGIPEDTLNQYIDTPQKVMVKELSPDHKSIITTFREYKPGKALWKDVIADQKLQDAQNANAEWNLAKLQNDTTQAQADKAKADAETELTPARKALLQAQANEANAKATAAKGGGSWKPYAGGTGPAGEPLFRNDQGDIQTAQQIAASAGRAYTGPKKVITAQDQNTYQQKYVLPMNSSEAIYNVLLKGYNDVRHGGGNGQEELSAMQASALNAMGLTGGGSRASGAQMIDRELGARGLIDQKTGFFSKIANGKSLSERDWRNMLDNAQNHLAGTTTKAAEGAKGFGMPATQLIKDQGKDTKVNRAVAQGYGIPAGYQQVITDANGKVLGFGKKDKDGTPTLYYDVYGEKM